MKTPLIRQGEGPAAAHHRLHQERADQRRKLDRIIRIADAAPDLDSRKRRRAGATADGDSRRLRGIPLAARGVGGTAPGSDPIAALIAKEARLRTVH